MTQRRKTHSILEMAELAYTGLGSKIIETQNMSIKFKSTQEIIEFNLL